MRQNILFADFSLSGPTLQGGMKIANQAKGNTRQAAEFIQNAVGGDLFSIETVQSYPHDHMKTIQIAQEELDENARPALKELPEHWNDYDIIYLGYPNWWNTFPMAVATFVESLDWSGKTIIPFCTNEGSGLGASIRDLKRLAPKAKILDGVSFTGHQVASCEKKIVRWAKEALCCAHHIPFHPHQLIPFQNGQSPYKSNSHNRIIKDSFRKEEGDMYEFRSEHK